MSLPKVLVHADAGEPPTIVVDGAPVSGVQSAQVTVAADGVPRVVIVLSASSVELELPAGVTVLRAGPTATEFVQHLQPQRLEQDALAYDDLTMGESFVAAAGVQAAEFDVGR